MYLDHTWLHEWRYQANKVKPNAIEGAVGFLFLPLNHAIGMPLSVQVERGAG